MIGLTDAVGRAFLRAASHAAVCLLAIGTGTVLAKAETRTLKIYHLHTHEKEEIAYKSNGRYLPEGLKKINWILRDWRKQQPVNMDPRLLDLVWEAYRQSGSRSYIQVICGYRSADTNGMLRSRTSGVAKESQHMLGKALDFTLPDVPLAKLRAIGLKMQIGGVGFYPKSGSPFVHFDVGNVRHWPKMSRQELMAVFPNGNTLHVPSDGKPLPGYEQALASYKARKGASSIQVANAGDTPAASRGGGKTLLAMLFGGGGADEEEDTAEAATTKVAPAKAVAAGRKDDDRATPAVKAPSKPAEAVAVAALAPSRTLPSGVPLPIRDTFDTSAPKTMTPPADLTGERTEVAALDPSRIPLPSAAPVRETALVAEAAKVPVPSAAPEPIEESLIAAIEKAPSAEEIAANRAGQLAYSVPMPSRRPPFASILKQETPSADTIDEVRAIVETANAEMPPSAAPAATALVLPASHPVSTQTQQHAERKLMIAALEAQKKVPVAASPKLAAAIPAGKTGRLKGRDARSDALAFAAQPASQDAISARIQMADLGDGNKRSEPSKAGRPHADRLARVVPAAAGADGIANAQSASTGLAGSTADAGATPKVD